MLPFEAEWFPILRELKKPVGICLEVGTRFLWKQSARIALFAKMKEGENICRFEPINIYLNMKELVFRNNQTHIGKIRFALLKILREQGLHAFTSNTTSQENGKASDSFRKEVC